MSVQEYLMTVRHDDRLRSAAQQRKVRQLRDLARQPRRAAPASRRIIRFLKRTRPVTLPA